MKYRLILFFCGLSLLMVCLWQHLFHLPLVMIPYHVIVAAVVHIIALSAFALIYRSFPYRIVSSLTIGFWLLIVFFFYLLIFGSMSFWGDIATVRILGTYFKDFGGFLHSMPFTYGEEVTVVVVFLVLPFLITLLFSKKTEAALRDLGDGIVEHKKLLMSLCVVAILASPLLLKVKRTIHKRGEPVMVMLFDHMWGVTDNPLFSRRRVRVGFEDQQIRKQYAVQNPQTKSGKNVILIIVDALRADHLSAYGYKRKTSPFIDGLIDSGKAVKVNRCYSTCSSTLCGVTSILLSRTWNECAVNGLNVIGLLHDQGYQTHALISGAHREWYNMAKFYSDDCQYYDGKDSKKYYFKDDRVLLEGMDGVRPYADTSSFFYFHLQSTHESGSLQDKYAVYKPFKKSITTRGMNGEAAINEYDNKVLQADDMIRQIFEALDRKGYLKNSIVVITGDHGQGLGEHGVSGHVDWLYDPQVSVPLIIYDDSISLYHNPILARHIDIAPTIIDRLRLPKPQSWMGMSLLRDGVVPYSYHETGKNDLETGLAKYMIVLIPGPSPKEKGEIQTSALYKYIFTADFKQEELYEINSDPVENNNLVSTQKQVLELMRSKARMEMDTMYGSR